MNAQKPCTTRCMCASIRFGGKISWHTSPANCLTSPPHTFDSSVLKTTRLGRTQSKAGIYYSWRHTQKRKQHTCTLTMMIGENECLSTPLNVANFPCCTFVSLAAADAACHIANMSIDAYTSINWAILLLKLWYSCLIFKASCR